MNKRTLVLLLLVVAFVSIGYAIYRSTDQRVTYNEDFKQTTTGEPQHGLIMGLCIFAGFCVLGTVPLLLDRRTDVVQEEPAVATKRTLL